MDVDGQGILKPVEWTSYLAKISGHASSNKGIFFLDVSSMAAQTQCP